MSSVDLDDKVAIVTGGAGGIGSETVRLMAARGARIVIADIAEDRAVALAAELGTDVATGIGFDLADEASVQAMIGKAVEHFGRLDILVNNAANLSPELNMVDMDIASMPTWAWDKTFNANCRGTMIAMREALPHLVETRGTIVNVVSNLALQGHIIQAAYSASKAAIIQMTRSVAASHGRKGVRCNAVAPGMTMTPALKAAFPAEIRAMIEAETLREQLGDPEDLAEVIAFLASAAARNITGQLIVADGGFASHVPGFGPFSAALAAMHPAE